ncbi:MAG: cobyric acid synthase [Lachnospiraceae bacterium]|nr:cobyric acid synthase [Lachnospiraceae bacterium]
MAKAIMIQGTMSNAGKSLVTAGLCRVFKQDGYKVAPFKSQNMALNSYITDEGLEMGRAQVMQAEAAGIKPSVLMNPILLKPTNDKGSQVIVNGEVLDNMNAWDYYEFKSKLLPHVQKAFDTLAAENDIIVIEGAGSPAEINLNKEDFVNMGMAKIAGAPVLLVGDIDRGGVFAQLYGTVMLLPEEDRNRIKGLVVNKFRGDKAILDPGLDMIEERVNIPVVGVLPYTYVDVDDEDGLSERMTRKNTIGKVDIVVPRLPRISNFTDFNIFESFEGVSLRYVHDPKSLGNPDMIILPGTKNTMGDLKWLRESGMEAAIMHAVDKGAVVFGVCGGYQMLGETISDPHGVEEGGEMRGLGLLPMDTVFEAAKTRTRVEGKFGKVEGVLSSLTGVDIEGYEIHMGISTVKNNKTLTNITGKVDEASNAGGTAGGEYFTKNEGAFAGNAYGTYVHGVFDKEGVAVAILSDLAKRKGVELQELESFDYKAYKEEQYDKLADMVRNNMDMKKVYEILGM